jgi:hypothetical protein
MKVSFIIVHRDVLVHIELEFKKGEKQKSLRKIHEARERTDKLHAGLEIMAVQWPDMTTSQVI